MTKNASLRENVAAVLAREIYPWTDEYRKTVRWPRDLTKEERAQCRKIATKIIKAVKA